VSGVSATQVKSFIASNLGTQEVSDELDLIQSGVVDSFGLLELIGDLEEHFDIEIDFEELDPERIAVVGPLARFIEQEAAAAA
jgi:acyl carrier protein